MKIGILTYHRTLNYGGCLQALATRYILETFGHEVYYVDYFPNYHKSHYSILNWNQYKTGSIMTRVKWFIHDLKCIPFVIKRKRSFTKYHKEFTLSYCRSLYDTYDIVVYGSDQIWRKQNALGDYNPIYFAVNCIKSKKHIAYSASMGILPENKEDINKVLLMLKHFDKISVREKDLFNFLKINGFNNVKNTLDPTLLITKEQWLSLFNIKKDNFINYVLIYDLNEGVLNIEAIRLFASQKGLKLKILKGYATHKDTEEEITTAGPSEFLSLIYNADYVFTSSFHGLVFSIIFEKEVFTSFNTNSGRARSLLNLLDLSDRFIEVGASIPQNLKKIDYNIIGTRLDQLKIESLNYLRNL